MAQAETRSMPSLTVNRLSPALGAEVLGVSFAEPLGDAGREAILAAWMEHLVLVFRDQDVSDEQHVAFTRNFGDLEVHHQKIIKSTHVPEIFKVGNVDDEGRLIPPANETVRQLTSARRWHTDSSFREIPSMGSLLHGIEIAQSGGETLFTNMYAVYEALPDSLKREVEGRRARHNFDYLRVLTGLPPVSEEERAQRPPIWQPMVRRHPVSGRKSLFISLIYNDEIEGMTAAQSEELISTLAEFVDQERFVYRHKWRPHDVVMWDNRCTMHRVTPWDPNERRVMHRTTIAGDGPVIAA